MKYIEIGFELTDDLGLKAISFNHNDTGLEENSQLLKRLALTILEGLAVNKESVAVQDLLNDLNIPITNNQ